MVCALLMHSSAELSVKIASYEMLCSEGYSLIVDNNSEKPSILIDSQNATYNDFKASATYKRGKVLSASLLQLNSPSCCCRSQEVRCGGCRPDGMSQDH